MPWGAVVPVRRRLAIIPRQHQEVTSGVGADREVTTEGGGGDGSLGKVLPRGSSGGALVWSRDMGDFGNNDAEVRGSACGFPAAGHKKKVKTSGGWVLAAGDSKNIPTGIGDTAAPDICGHDTGNSGGVGVPTVYF